MIVKKIEVDSSLKFSQCQRLRLNIEACQIKTPHPRRGGGRCRNGGASKTDIEPPTKRLSQNGMSLKEYLDQEEEMTEEITPFEPCKETFEIFKRVYLEFYYWVRGNIEMVEEFSRLAREVANE